MESAHECKEMIDMARSISCLKENMKKRLLGFGLDESRIEEVISLFDKKNRHIDVISFIVLLERYGVARSNITSFLKEVGVDDATIINIFTKADRKKGGLVGGDITQVILEE